MRSEIQLLILQRIFLQIFPILLIVILWGCDEENTVDQYDEIFQVYNSKQQITVLDGKMLFYWDQLLEPSDFVGLNSPEASALVEFPDTWNNFEIDGKRLPGRGHATYRAWFTVDTVVPMALKADDYCNAFRLWINGKLVAGDGVPGVSAGRNKAAKVNVVESFVPVKGLNELVLQTANYEEKYGGLRQPILIGTESQVRQTASGEKVADAFVLGLILMMALYHLTLFALNRKRKAFLWFGLMAFFIALRQGLLSHIQIFNPWVQDNVHFYLKLSIAAAILTSVALFFFFHSVYPNWLKKWIRDLYCFVALTFTILALVLPVYTVSVGIHFIQFFVIAGLVYIFYLTIRSFSDSSKFKWMIGIGVLLFLLATGFEALIFNRTVYTGYTLHYGLIVFIVFQSFALSADFSKASRENEKLTKALDRHNKNLQKEVELKSREAIEAKERELLSVMMQKLGTDTLLKKIEDKLKPISNTNIKSNDEIISGVVKLINNTLISDESDKYLFHFEKIYPGFLDALQYSHPGLSQNELKLCAYLRMNLGNREIAGFLYVEPESVRKAKTRMSKKMWLK
jgi:hypothetical protein